MKKIFLPSLILFSLFILPLAAFAAFTISVTPYEGGYDLRYGKVGIGFDRVNKEINVNITSNIAKQYRIVQQFLEPVTNDQGVALSQEQFVVYGIRGTNKYGTLNVEQEIPVSLGRSILYTSNSSGTSDSFILVYGLKGPLNVPAGSYRGRISFTLEPIDTTQAQVTQILNIFMEIEIQSTIEIKTANGASRISLDSEKEEMRTQDVLVDINGDLGNQFRILQLLLKPLESVEGNQLSGEAINFMISQAKKGSGPNKPKPFSGQPQEIIYTSGTKGEADSFTITYSLAEPDKYKAGRYKAKLIYIIERPGMQNTLEPFDLEVNIAPIFDLVIQPELGGIIGFRNIKPSAVPQPYISEVAIEIKNNTGKQYQVSQKLLSELANKEGKIISPENLTLRTENMNTENIALGTLKFPQKATVEKKEMTLFTSDKKGSPDTFKVIYELLVGLDLEPGDYSLQLVYSISEL